MHLNTVEQSSAKITFLTSASEKYFCVGANIGVLQTLSTETIEDWVKEGHKVLNRLETLKCPVVALVSGYAMGGGLEIAMACDLMFADYDAKFAQTEAKLGFIPGWGGCRRLVDRVGTSKAKYLFYSGTVLNGKSAAECGLVDFVGSPNELAVFKDEFTSAVLKNNYNAITSFKEIVNEEEKMRRKRNMEVEASHSIGCLEDKDTLSRIDVFLNKGK